MKAAERFIYQPGKKKGLAAHDPAFTDDRDEAVWRERLAAHCAEIAKAQDYLMAHEQFGLVVLFQAMDGAGKDATIKNVMSQLDPQGCEMKAFKKQTPKEKKHDFLWRAAAAMPARGQIAIFNRSYYENVIADRVHPEILKEQNLPKDLAGGDIWERRFEHINNFERYLKDEGIHTMKFFLHISRDEQARKLLERMQRPEKKWKWSSSDIRERPHWNKYMKAYEAVFEGTSTEVSPWHIVPGNNRWFARSMVAEALLEKLRSFHGRYPALSKDQAEEMKTAEAQLTKELGGRARSASRS